MLWKSEVKVKMEPRMDADTNLGGSKSPLIILLAVGMGFRLAAPWPAVSLEKGPVAFLASWAPDAPVLFAGFVCPLGGESRLSRRKMSVG